MDFDHEFPLDHGSRGRASECSVCHQDAPRSYRTYTCYGCHEHSPARVAAEHREEGVRNLDDCVRCHATGREHEGRGERGERRRGEGARSGRAATTAEGERGGSDARRGFRVRVASGVVRPYDPRLERRAAGAAAEQCWNSRPRLVR